MVYFNLSKFSDTRHKVILSKKEITKLYKELQKDKKATGFIFGLEKTQRGIK